MKMKINSLDLETALHRYKGYEHFKTTFVANWVENQWITMQSCHAGVCDGKLTAMLLFCYESTYTLYSFTLYSFICHLMYNVEDLISVSIYNVHNLYWFILIF